MRGVARTAYVVPGRLRRLLGPLGGVLDASWVPLGSLLGPFRDLLVSLGSLLGASWGAFWGLLAPLGCSWGPLGGFWGRRPKNKNQKSTPKWTIWGPKMGPRWDPKRTKIEDENEHRKSSSSRPPWRLLGVILGRFRCHLGGQ